MEEEEKVNKSIKFDFQNENEDNQLIEQEEKKNQTDQLDLSTKIITKIALVIVIGYFTYALYYIITNS